MKKIKVQKRPKQKSLSSTASHEHYLNKHTYLKEIIETDSQDKKKFLCKLCTNHQPTINGVKEPITGQITWLKKHLETNRHTIITPKKDLERLQEAILALSKSELPIPR